MILLVLAAQASAVDAERAFAATAHVKGQWTAFRRYASQEAVMFVPQPVRAQDWLKDRKDPPVSVQWQPATVFDSCDGERAVTTGPWTAEAGRQGTFTTVWARSEAGWHWDMDHGRDTPRPVLATGDVRHVRPACDLLPGAADKTGDVAQDRFAGDVLVQRDDAMPVTGQPPKQPAAAVATTILTGESQDRTLRWRSAPIAGKPGAHDLIVSQWQGRAKGWRIVLYETTGAGPEAGAGMTR